MPVVFIGHGSPMNAIERNDFTRTLADLGARLPHPAAILSISAHWYIGDLLVLSHPRPETIHDFWGFPRPLYQVRYPAPGYPAGAAVTANLLREDQAMESEEWGFDHGTWSVLVHMFPKADIPVFQLSLDYRRSPQDHYRLGQKIKGLREQGVLILGSGNIVHNLARIVPGRNAQPWSWAIEFDAGIKEALVSHNHDALTNYEQTFAATARFAVPTPDHYLPLLYCAAASEAAEAPQFPFEGFEQASISMRAVQWG
jgi:4,5-DOPA dioxygenase extradiol